MIVADRVIAAPNLSVAWADALGYLLDVPGHSVVNLTLRIEDPLTEESPIRATADRLLDAESLQDVNEVANTIFPVEWAQDLPDPSQLAADYREHYDFLREIDRANVRGTYFGRIVAFPDASGEPIDQLGETVRKLRQGRKGGQIYHSVYEINIYHAGKDRKVRRGFPCLAHVGMHVDSAGRLNATAQYRSHDVVAKGYGNYLGLGGLLGYVAEAAGFPVGELFVLAGGAFFEARVGPVRAAVNEAFSASTLVTSSGP